MFSHKRRREDSWDGVVTGKKRSSPPDGQNVYHRIDVTLSDGSVRQVRVRRALWAELQPGDRLVKRPGEEDPAKPG